MQIRDCKVKEDMGTPWWSLEEKRKAAALLLLDRKLDARDLKMRIMVEAFPPPSHETVHSFLKERGLSNAYKPDFLGLGRLTPVRCNW